MQKMPLTGKEPKGPIIRDKKFRSDQENQPFLKQRLVIFLFSGVLLSICILFLIVGIIYLTGLFYPFSFIAFSTTLVAALFISFGSVIIILTVGNIYFVLTGHDKFVGLTTIASLVLLTILFAIGIWGLSVATGPSFTSTIRLGLQETFMSYKADNPEDYATRKIDWLQRTFNCCGIDSYQDFKGFYLYGQTQSAVGYVANGYNAYLNAPSTISVPDSCCINAFYQCGRTSFQYSGSGSKKNFEQLKLENKAAIEANRDNFNRNKLPNIPPIGPYNAVSNRPYYDNNINNNMQYAKNSGPNYVNNQYPVNNNPNLLNTNLQQNLNNNPNINNNVYPNNLQSNLNNLQTNLNNNLQPNNLYPNNLQSNLNNPPIQQNLNNIQPNLNNLYQNNLQSNLNNLNTAAQQNLNNIQPTLNNLQQNLNNLNPLNNLQSNQPYGQQVVGQFANNNQYAQTNQFGQAGQFGQIRNKRDAVWQDGYFNYPVIQPDTDTLRSNTNFNTQGCLHLYLKQYKKDLINVAAICFAVPLIGIISCAIFIGIYFFVQRRSSSK